MAKEKFNGKRLGITICLVLITAILFGGTLWYGAMQIRADAINQLIRSSETTTNCQNETTVKFVNIGEETKGEYRNNIYKFTFIPGYSEVLESPDKSNGTNYIFRSFGIADGATGPDFLFTINKNGVDAPKFGKAIIYDLAVQDNKVVINGVKDVDNGLPADYPNDPRSKIESWGIYGAFRYKDNVYSISNLTPSLSKSESKSLSEEITRLIKSIKFDN